MKIRFDFHKKPLQYGLLMALAGLVFACLCGKPLLGLAAFPFLVGVWCVWVSFGEKWTPSLVWVLVAVSSVLAFLMVQSCVGVVFSIRQMPWKRMLLNLGCYAFCISLTHLLTGKLKFSVVFTMAWTMILATVNYFTAIFRGREMMLPDLLSVRTAMNVVGRYTFEPSALMVFAWLAFAGWAVLLYRGIQIPESRKANRRWKSLVTAVLSFTLSFSLRDTVYDEFALTSDFDGSIRNGFLVNFVFRSQFIEKPEEYGDFDFTIAEQNYATPDQETKKPNVIVIMGEAFADMRVFNGEVRTTKPVTPYIDALSENTIKGMALSSVYGGSTCNSEYEFLTGNTLSFLPEGCIPFQQYVTGDTYSLAYYLRSLGYETLATHPNEGAAWDRDRVWTSLGFEDCMFLDQYDQEHLSRDYIPDRDVFEKITAALEEKEPGEPLFAFAVTIKAHSPYGQEGSEAFTTVHLEGYQGHYPGVEEYLSLMNETDAAVQYLLEYLEAYGEDTIVLFYGDHQPAFGSGFQEELYGAKFIGLDSQQVLYTVPYFIWANFDIPEEKAELTSINYLSNALLEAAGLELAPYGRFLKDVEAVIPAVNALGYYSEQAGRFLPVGEAQGQEKEALSDYSCMQYNAVRGGAKRSEVFFGRYTD